MQLKDSTVANFLSILILPHEKLNKISLANARQNTTMFVVREKTIPKMNHWPFPSLTSGISQ